MVGRRVGEKWLFVCFILHKHAHLDFGNSFILTNSVSGSLCIVSQNEFVDRGAHDLGFFQIQRTSGLTNVCGINQNLDSIDLRLTDRLYLRISSIGIGHDI